MNDNIFLESYLGKDSLLLECESILDKMIPIIRNNPTENISKSQLNKQLEQTLAKKFGIKKVTIYWSNKKLINAFTIVNSHAVGTTMGKSTKMKKGKQYYDTDGTEVLSIIVMRQFVYGYENITGAQLLALILHEIGHNFEFTTYNSLTFLFSIMKDSNTTVLNEILGSNTLKGFTTVVNTLPDRIINANPKISKLAHTVGNFFQLASDYLGLVVSPISLPVAAIGYILLSPIAGILTFVPRKHEEYADSFAAMYGYAPDLAEVFAYIIDGFNTDVRSAVSGNKFLSVLYDMGRCSSMIMFSMSDHSSNEQRIKKMMNKLKSDIDSLDYPESAKAALYADYKKIEMTYKSLITKTENEKLVITKTMLSISHNMFKDYDDLQYIILNKNNA